MIKETFTKTYYTDWHPEAVVRELLATTGLDGRGFFCLDKRPAKDRIKVRVTITVEEEPQNELADRREPIGEASSPKGDGRAAG